MEKDISTLLAERDAQIQKLELEKLRDENLHLIQQIKDKIDNAKAEITENAIVKTMKILDKTRLWLIYSSGVFAVLIGVAGVIGYTSITKQLTDYYINTVHHWLRFDSDDSGGSKVLNDLRTSALMDSLILKYERDKATFGPLPTISLNSESRQRLMDLILNPSTEQQQFVDALKIIMISRGIFGRYYEDDTSRKIVSILNNSDFSNSKRLDVLNAMIKDKALLPWSLAVISKDNSIYDEEISMSAFRNVALFDNEIAIKFATKNINSFKNDINKIELGVFLIKNNADSNDVNNLIKNLRDRKKDDVLNGYGRLVIAKLEKGIDVKVNKNFVDYMTQQIEDGIRISLESSLKNKSVLSFKINGGFYPFSNPEEFYSNHELINNIMHSLPLSYERLVKYTRFFQLQDRGYWITTLMFKPSSETFLILDDGKKITGKDILKYVWIREEESAGKMTLIASWRDKDGTLYNSALKNIEGIENCNFSVDFDRDQLRNYTWSPDYNNFDE